MKTNIDNLMREILNDLAQSKRSCLELATYFEHIGADAHSRAVAKRDIIASYVIDMNLSAEIREYDQNALDALPSQLLF